MTEVKETAERISTERLGKIIDAVVARRSTTPVREEWQFFCEVQAALTELLAFRHADVQEGGEAQCCMCGKKGLSTIEGDGGTECQLEDGRWTCSQDCYYTAVDWFSRPSAAPSNPVVSNAMVERTAAKVRSACNRFDVAQKTEPDIEAWYRAQAISILAAALSVNPQSGSQS